MVATDAAWASEGVRIPRAVLEEIESFSREAYAAGLEKDGAFEGEEACGVLTGPSSDARLADSAVRLPNLANKYHRAMPDDYPRTGRMYFLIDPRKFAALVAEGQSSARPVKVLWHSHLDVGAYFSETDAAAALAGGTSPSYDLAYLVVSVRGDGRGGGAHVDDRKLFVWDPKARAFVDAKLDVV